MDRITERRHDPSRYDCTGSEGSPREVEILLHVPSGTPYLRPPSRRHHDPERCDRHGQMRRENRGKSGRNRRRKSGRPCRRHASSRFEDERYGCRRCYHSKVYRFKRRNSFVFVRGVHFSISYYLYAEGSVLRTEPNCLHLNIQ